MTYLYDYLLNIYHPKREQTLGGWERVCFVHQSNPQHQTSVWFITVVIIRQHSAVVQTDTNLASFVTLAFQGG